MISTREQRAKLYDDARAWVCEECGERVEVRSGLWRLGFDGWEHYHARTSGYERSKREPIDETIPTPL